MNKMYVIHWKSKINGRAGTGTKLLEREAAEALVEELNREYPQIEHEIWEAERMTGETLSDADNKVEPVEPTPAIKDN